MNKYRNLLRRVAYLESLLIEGKQDQEKLLNFLGQDYYNKYNLIKDKIQDPEYKDIYRMMKKDPSEVEDYIDELSKKQSNMDLRSEAKKGAKLIYNQNGWKVYRITTYEAAVYYGSNTRWCITGRYDGFRDEGRSYFNDYIRDYDLDGGYYFCIKNNTEKYCVLRRKNGKIQSIWDAADNDIDDILEEVPDFPSIKGLWDLTDPTSTERGTRRLLSDLLFSGNINDIQYAISNGAEITSPSDTHDGKTPIEWYVTKNNRQALSLLLDTGVNINRCTEAVTEAICDNKYELIDLFFDYGLNPNGYMDSIWKTPFFEEVLYRNNYKMVKLFLENGADIKNPIFLGDQTAFQYSVTNEAINSVRAIYDYKHDSDLLLEVINSSYNKRLPLPDVLSVLDRAKIDYNEYV